MTDPATPSGRDSATIAPVTGVLSAEAIQKLVEQAEVSCDDYTFSVVKALAKSHAILHKQAKTFASHLSIANDRLRKAGML